MRNYPYQIISDIVTVYFIISQQLWGLHLNSQVPERSRGPRACCARSGTNGKGGVRSLQKIFGGAEMVIPIRNSQIFYESCLKLIYFNLILLKIFRKKNHKIFWTPAIILWYWQTDYCISGRLDFIISVWNFQIFSSDIKVFRLITIERLLSSPVLIFNF